MLNQIVLVGRIVRDPELKETDDGIKYTNITLAVPRSYKNLEGEYETDFIGCKLWKYIAESTTEYCKKGDLVGIRGRLESKTNEGKNEIEVVVEKVTFLSSRKEEE